MSATAQKTITVTGTQLADLKAANLAVAGNTIASVVANADGTSAVVTLGTDLVPDTNVKVTATIDGTAKEYTVKYTIAATTVVVQTATYDDDKANQVLTVLVNGVETTPSYLASSGYTVTFRAWKNGVATTELFGGLTSTSGVLNMTPATVKDNDYTVNVTIQKGSSIAVSEKATIKIRDLDNNASEISSTKILNITKGMTMTSGKLVPGEAARFSKVVVGYGDAAAELTTGFAVESSNAAVISVNSTTKVMTANGVGTANITVTVGKASVVVPITVVGEARKASTVTSNEENVSIIVGSARNATVVVKDQYGDPFVGATSLTYVLPTSITGLTCTTPMTSNAKGEVVLAYGAGTTLANQTGIVVFKNSDKVVVGSQNLATVAPSGVEATKVVYDATSESTDDVIYTDLTSKDSLAYKVSEYGANNVWIRDLSTLAGYTIMFDGNYIAVNGDTTGTYVVPTTTPATAKLIVTPIKAGTSSFVVQNTMSEELDRRTITVLKDAPKISSIAFKTPVTINYAKTIDYKDVLNYTEMTTQDDIISGVTLTTSTLFSVRIQESNTFAGSATTPVGAVGNLYLDKNSTGAYDEGDVALGSFKTKVSADATGTWVAGTESDGFAGQAVAAGDKGTLNFTVVDLATAPYTTIVGNTYTTVNVPQSVDAQAIAAINAGSKTSPSTVTVANYAAAGVTGVTTANLTYVNEIVKAALITAGTDFTTAGDIQTAIGTGAADYNTALAAVVALEAAPTGANKTTADAAVSALTAGVSRTALETRVTTAMYNAAVATVVTLEATPNQANKDAADTAVALVAAGAPKTALETRVTAAVTIDTAKTTITANPIAAAEDSTATATVVPKNAAGVTLAADLITSYTWSVDSASPAVANAVATNGNTATVTITVTTLDLTASPVGLSVDVVDDETTTVSKTVNMVVTGL